MGFTHYQISIWLIEDVMLVFVYSLANLIQGSCYSCLTLGTSGLELASTIILVLQAIRLTKCTSSPNIPYDNNLNNEEQKQNKTKIKKHQAKFVRSIISGIHCDIFFNRHELFLKFR